MPNDRAKLPPPAGVTLVLRETDLAGGGQLQRLVRRGWTRHSLRACELAGMTLSFAHFREAMSMTNR
jgi:hypothetical protein